MKKKKRRRKKVPSAGLERRQHEDRGRGEKKKAAEERKGSGSLSESSESLVPTTACKLWLSAKARSRVRGPSGACVESDMR